MTRRGSTAQHQILIRSSVGNRANNSASEGTSDAAAGDEAEEDGVEVAASGWASDPAGENGAESRAGAMMPGIAARGVVRVELWFFLSTRLLLCPALDKGSGHSGDGNHAKQRRRFFLLVPVG